MSGGTGDPRIPLDWNPAWEPIDLTQWFERDPLGTRLRERDHTRAERAEAVALNEFLAWSKLPRGLRQQSWREREIAAAILDREQMWFNVAEIRRIGVGLRTLSGQRRLAIVASVAQDADFGGPVDAFPAPLDIPSAIPASPPLSPVVPIVFEPYNPSVPVADHGPLVGRQECIGEPPRAPCSRAAVGPATVVRERNARALGGRRSVGLIVVDPFGSPRLLTAAHGLSRDDAVMCLDDGTDIGRVDGIERRLDCALIRVDNQIYQFLEMPDPSLVPNEPILPIGGLPVQMCGGISRHRTGHILDSYSFDTTGGYRIGHHVDVVTTIAVQQGDSGSVLLSGHSDKSPFSPARQGYYSKQLIEALTFAALGILLEGTDEAAPSEQQRQSSFVPIVEALGVLDVSVPTDLTPFGGRLYVHDAAMAPAP